MSGNVSSKLLYSHSRLRASFKVHVDDLEKTSKYPTKDDKGCQKLSLQNLSM